MGCSCNKRNQVVQGGETLGFIVIYPDGTSTPADAPILSITEAKRLIREAGGGTVKRLVRQS